MSLTSPNLDDRTFQQLLEEAQGLVKKTCPAWNDFSAGDPGTALLELFAHLTEVMIYRLNRLPEKAYIEFLRLMGVRLRPPAAARVELRFQLNPSQQQALEIPRGTRVTVSRPGSGAEAPVFATADVVRLAPGKTEADVLAFHCELVEGEPAGIGTGLPGQSVTARRPPIVVPTGDAIDLVVGVEIAQQTSASRVHALEWEGKAYRIWREVDNFTDLSPDDFVYVVDRFQGTITFAPALEVLRDDRLQPRQALAQAPEAGREIRLWYRSGGGPTGNVAANTLTVLKEPILGVSVTNPFPALGGAAAETLENALLRGPYELRTPNRAVTAADFERFALAEGVVRARAFTQRRLWNHAVPGTVEVRIVPDVRLEHRGPHGQVTAEQLRSFQTDAVHSAIERTLEERRPLGTACQVHWARCKTVSITARVVAFHGSDENAIRSRILDRLHRTINPVPTEGRGGWGFGQPLRASHLYDLVLQEPGVSFLDNSRFFVDDVPAKNVVSLAADFSQPHTWNACSAEPLLPSSNDGDGWEAVGHFPDELIEVVRTMPGRLDLPTAGRPGLVAVSTLLTGDQDRCRVYVSRDCGESWDPLWAQTRFTVQDMAWMLRDQIPVLLLATDVGLYELRQNADPVQILVDPADQNRGFYAVAVGTAVLGNASVAVAGQGTGGVFLSNRSGAAGTFVNIGLRGEDIRVLDVQYDGPRAFLWAAAWAEKEKPGSGCYRWELTGATPSPEGWRPFSNNWKGGSCLALAFQQNRILAATRRAGVLRLDTEVKDPAWQFPDFALSGLPVRDESRLVAVAAVAADPSGRLLMAGGEVGVFRSQDGGESYERSSPQEFTDRVTLPETWLFCSGEHKIEVVIGEESNRDK